MVRNDDDYGDDYDDDDGYGVDYDNDNDDACGDDFNGNDACIILYLTRFVVMNFIVHSIMYSYYALRAMRFSLILCNFVDEIIPIGFH